MNLGTAGPDALDHEDSAVRDEKIPRKKRVKVGTIPAEMQ